MYGSGIANINLTSANGYDVMNMKPCMFFLQNIEFIMLLYRVSSIRVLTSIITLFNKQFLNELFYIYQSIPIKNKAQYQEN